MATMSFPTCVKIDLRYSRVAGSSRQSSKHEALKTVQRVHKVRAVKYGPPCEDFQESDRIRKNNESGLVIFIEKFVCSLVVWLAY